MKAGPFTEGCLSQNTFTQRIIVVDEAAKEAYLKAWKKQVWRGSMFHIDYPEPDVVIKTPLEKIMQEEYLGPIRDALHQQNRMFYGDPTWKAYIKAIPFKHCDAQGMLSRLHDFSIKRVAPMPCYTCGGHLEYFAGDDDYGYDFVPEQCHDCLNGVRPGYFRYECKRCQLSFNKGV